MTTNPRGNVPPILLIQGVFWQRAQWLSIGMEPVEGAVALINTGIVDFMYSGFVGPDPQSLLGESSGRMFDNFGRAQITRFHMTPDRLTFLKQYDQRDYAIEYVFPTRNGNIWDGYYNHSVTGCGLTRCLVTEVTREFFNPSNFLEAMKKFCPGLAEDMTLKKKPKPKK